jgi:hypothetical protein
LDDIHKQQVFARLETFGEQQVRLMVSTGQLPPAWNLTIVEWLKEKDNENLLRKGRLQDEQYQIALSSKKAAWIAAYAAIAAAIIAVIGVIVTLIAWEWPH